MPFEQETLDHPLDARLRDIDPATGLVVRSNRAGSRLTDVRESAQTALWLAHRGTPADLAAAHRMLEAVLSLQHTREGAAYFGTWPMHHDQTPPPVPPATARVWHDYDPNWREFIGMSFIVLLEEHADRLQPSLVADIETALRRAATGSLDRALPSSYANVALMRALLLHWSGVRFGQNVWQQTGRDFARAIHDEFMVHHAFDEFNSPTYYEVDLYALGLWVTYAPSDEFKGWARAMEAGLWRDIARFYHPGLDEICGPYDRAYGMRSPDDGSELLGWIHAAQRSSTSDTQDQTPFNSPGYFTGLRVPEAVRAQLRAFDGPRRVGRRITTLPRRDVTAWLGESLMIGGQDAHFAKPVWPGQYEMATAHWRLPGGGLGWLRLIPTLPTDARAGENRLEVWSYRWPGVGGPGIRHTFEIEAPGIDSAAIQPHQWSLPGLTIRVHTDLLPDGVMRVEGEPDRIRIAYDTSNFDCGTMVRFDLRFVTH